MQTSYTFSPAKAHMILLRGCMHSLPIRQQVLITLKGLKQPPPALSEEAQKWNSNSKGRACWNVRHSFRE